jgi:cell division protein FtsL
MNIATRTLTQGSVIITNTQGKALTLPLPKRHVLLLLSIVLATALTLIYVKDLNRCLFIDYQESQKVAQKLEIEHDKLLLEESAWANSARIQRISEQKWHMQSPLPSKMVLVEIP